MLEIFVCQDIQTFIPICNYFKVLPLSTNTFFQMEHFFESVFNLQQGLPILISYMTYVIILDWQVHYLFDSICAMPWCNRLRNKWVFNLEERGNLGGYTL